jgi:hypothetical protein
LDVFNWMIGFKRALGFNGSGLSNDLDLLGFSRTSGGFSEDRMIRFRLLVQRFKAGREIENLFDKVEISPDESEKCPTNGRERRGKEPCGRRARGYSGVPLLRPCDPCQWVSGCRGDR